MPLPPKRELSIEYLMRQSFPNATENAINFYLQALDIPDWESERGWVNHIPKWMQRVWKNLPRREQAIAYIFASWMAIQAECLLDEEEFYAERE
jgi:hypothetical protein